MLFLNILQKFNKLPFLGAFDMSGFHQKPIIQLVEILILMNSKVKSIHNFFLEILQAHCKLAILESLGMLDHTYTKTVAILFLMVKNFVQLTLSKKSTSSLTSS